ncbi:6197_t:CDS:2 [Funneliformis caledonium]|uniref:6197_t:CDS:1 n=1 Tax=Funneliformis caledonium TaxID=1117310 RepID=A0A9N9FM90_9GLOM|nr:6197_t:CDS:2 [Funneliformis caledonium]
MQNQGYSSLPPPIPIRPGETTYGSCMENHCDCSSIVHNETDPERCLNCSHDKVMHTNLQIEKLSLNDNINHMNYGRCTDFNCDCLDMIPGEHNPLICCRCNHDHLKHAILPSNDNGNQLRYGKCMACDCICMILNDRDPTKCYICTHDREIHLNYDNQTDCNINMYSLPPLPPQVREQPPPNTIWFYNRYDPYYEFTNFQQGFPIKAIIPFPQSAALEVKRWPTSEHLFQAAKFQHYKEIADRIRQCATARDALNLARLYQAYTDPNWQSINVKVMEWVVRCKFEQHRFLARRLLETGDKRLVEHTEVDKFWGDGGDGSGKNMLGEILMRVRQHLKDTQSYHENNGYNPSIENNLIYPMSYQYALPSSQGEGLFQQPPIQEELPQLPSSQTANHQQQREAANIAQGYHQQQ